MNIVINKPVKNKWKFPCLGKLDSGTIVYFSCWGIGVVVESEGDFKIGHSDLLWGMDKFTPIDINGFELNKLNPIDWDNITLPILAKSLIGNIILIYKIHEKRIDYLNIDGDYVRFTIEKTFCCMSDRDEWLRSLEIFPKGTEIKIII